MTPSFFLLKYARRREVCVRPAIEHILSPLVTTIPANRSVAIEYHGEVIDADKQASFLQSMAGRVVAETDDRFFDVSIGGGGETWSLVLLSGALVAVIARYEGHLSEHTLDRDRVRSIESTATRSAACDVFFDPKSQRYRGRQGPLYLFLKGRGQNPAFKGEVSASTAEAGELLLEELERLDEPVSVAARDVQSFLLRFEGGLSSDQRTRLQSALKSIGAVSD